MDRTFTDIQRNDENAAQSAPHLVEISIVPPGHPATDEPMPPQSPPRATEPGAEKKNGVGSCTRGRAFVATNHRCGRLRI